MIWAETVACSIRKKQMTEITKINTSNDTNKDKRLKAKECDNIILSNDKLESRNI